MVEILAVGGYLAAVSTVVWLIGVLTSRDSSPRPNAADAYDLPGIDETTGKV